MFYVKTATPMKKVTPSFPAPPSPSSKNWDPVKPLFLQIYMEATPPPPPPANRCGEVGVHTVIRGTTDETFQ